jgi:uncharacterized membrane protein YkoI
MTKRSKLLLVGGVVALVAAGGGSYAIATGGGDDDEAPITGDALDKASAAAIEHTGGGEVTETETADEESYYEVEVSREDGSQVDIQLDRDFNVVGDSADDESEDEAGDDD